MQQEEFLRKITEMKEIARLQGSVLTREQADEAIRELALDDKQQEFFFDYLKQNKIGIGEPVNLDEELSEQDSGYLKQYLEELEGLPTYDEAQKRVFAMGAMAGEKDAKEKLLTAYLPDVIEIAKLYAGQGVYLEDLIGEGNVALAGAVEMVGALEKPEEVQGMLGKSIMDAMEEFIGVDLEERKTDKKIEDKVNKVAEKAAELSASMRRKVTVEELSEETGLSRKEILDAVRMSGNKIEEIEAQAEEE